MEQHKLTHDTLQNIVWTRLTHLVNDDGDFVYPGDGDAEDRTGTNLNALLKYVFDKIGPKPHDTFLFVEFLHNVLKIPQDLLNSNQKWIKIN